MKQENYSSSKAIFKLIANIISWTALVILILIAVFLLYLTISSKIYASKGMDYEPKFALYTIISPSMEPNLRVYDIIIDNRVDSVNEIKIGDIITFVSTSSISSGKTVTHRVIDIIIDEHGNYLYKTKGDNNLSPDSAYVEFNNVIGKVLFKIPQLGRIQFFLANQGGWLVAIVIPALIIIIKDIMKIFKLSKVNKKAEIVVSNKEAEEEEKKKREAEEERKKRLKEKSLKNVTEKFEEYSNDLKNNAEKDYENQELKQDESNDLKENKDNYDETISEDLDKEFDESTHTESESYYEKEDEDSQIADFKDKTEEEISSKSVEKANGFSEKDIRFAVKTEEKTVKNSDFNKNYKYNKNNKRNKSHKKHK